MLESLSQPWHWSVSGLCIAAVLFGMLYAGKEFGFSSNLRTMCTLMGAGRNAEFFRIDWRAQRWNLLFAAGAVVGGLIGSTLLASPEPVQVSDATQTYLSSLGIASPNPGIHGDGFVPAELFALANLDVFNLLYLIVGGFFIGFGTRWAGGCTSGHAISGLANLQLPSLLAVVGFFLGGLVMTWLILPTLLTSIV